MASQSIYLKNGSGRSRQFSCCCNHPRVNNRSRNSSMGWGENTVSFSDQSSTTSCCSRSNERKPRSSMRDDGAYGIEQISDIPDRFISISRSSSAGSEISIEFSGSISLGSSIDCGSSMSGNSNFGNDIDVNDYGSYSYFGNSTIHPANNSNPSSINFTDNNSPDPDADLPVPIGVNLELLQQAFTIYKNLFINNDRDVLQFVSGVTSLPEEEHQLSEFSGIYKVKEIDQLPYAMEYSKHLVDRCFDYFCPPPPANPDFEKERQQPYYELVKKSPGGGEYDPLSYYSKIMSTLFP